MPQRELSTLVMTLCFSNLMSSESTKSRNAKGIGLDLQKIRNALSLIEFFHVLVRTNVRFENIVLQTLLIMIANSIYFQYFCRI